MGNKLELNPQFGADSKMPWNAEKTLASALAQRDSFLEKNPAYRSYQFEIDAILEKAGPAQNRMSVLALMMEAKLKELGDQMAGLQRILSDVAH